MADLPPFLASIDHLLNARRRRREREIARRRALVFATAVGTIGAAGLVWYQSRMRRSEQQIEVADRRVLPPPMLPDDIANKGDLQLLSDGFGKL